ncbi:hypothetical protein COLO4_09719 [Corchorus olitorius]|uniref:Uncharacterized protein n=1 Tax=Corchorus olitorius TaxID=93759 RepID=A0A1R3KBA2_9ROSI|nr:hypothetical protein COLO4_09719 [Corchorus olitorius]
MEVLRINVFIKLSETPNSFIQTKQCPTKVSSHRPDFIVFPRLQHHHYHHHHHHHHYYPKPNYNHDQKLLETPRKSLSLYDETSSNNQDQKLLEAPPKSLSQYVIAHDDETSSNNQGQKLLEAPPKSLSQDVIAYEETSSKEVSNSLGTEIIQIVPQKIDDKGKHIRHITPEFEFFDDEEEDEGPGNRISRCDSKYITLSRFQLLGIDARAEEFIQEKKEIWKFEWQKYEQELEQEFREMLARSV